MCLHIILHYIIWLYDWIVHRNGAVPSPGLPERGARRHATSSRWCFCVCSPRVHARAASSNGIFIHLHLNGSLTSALFSGVKKKKEKRRRGQCPDAVIQRTHAQQAEEKDASQQLLMEGDLHRSRWIHSMTQRHPTIKHKANNRLTFGRRTPDVGYGFTFSIGKLNTEIPANIRRMQIVSTYP